MREDDEMASDVRDLNELDHAAEFLRKAGARNDVDPALIGIGWAMIDIALSLRHVTVTVLNS